MIQTLRYLLARFLLIPGLISIIILLIAGNSAYAAPTQTTRTLTAQSQANAAHTHAQLRESVIHKTSCFPVFSCSYLRTPRAMHFTFPTFLEKPSGKPHFAKLVFETRCVITNLIPRFSREIRTLHTLVIVHRAPQFVFCLPLTTDHRPRTTDPPWPNSRGKNGERMIDQNLHFSKFSHSYFPLRNIFSGHHRRAMTDGPVPNRRWTLSGWYGRTHTKRGRNNRWALRLGQAARIPKLNRAGIGNTVG